MFEAVTYHEKRVALSEVILSQALGILDLIIDTNTQKGALAAAHLNQLRQQYGQATQVLADQEADRVLGPVGEETEETLTRNYVLGALTSNLGRTYLGVENTGAADGAIGTPGFGTKFKEWLSSLPKLKDELLNPTTGFYLDGETLIGQEIPCLIIRDGEVVYHVVYAGGLGIHELHLDHLPEVARTPHPVAGFSQLRREFITYRKSLTKAQFNAALASAIASYTDTPFVEYVEPVQAATQVEENNETATAE